VNTSLARIAAAAVLTCSAAFAHAAAPLPSADPAVVAATREMLAAMHVRESMTGMLASMEQQMPNQMRAAAAASINGNAGLSAQQKSEQLAKVEEGIAKNSAEMHAVFADPTLIDDMIAETVPLYAETYTLDEIRQLTAFYTSPLGRKMQANIPALMSRSFAISQRVMMPRMQKAMANSQPAPR
jgi:hypothetical protein